MCYYRELHAFRSTTMIFQRFARKNKRFLQIMHIQNNKILTGSLGFRSRVTFHRGKVDTFLFLDGVQIRVSAFNMGASIIRTVEIFGTCLKIWQYCCFVHQTVAWNVNCESNNYCQTQGIGCFIFHKKYTCNIIQQRKHLNYIVQFVHQSVVLPND